MKQFFRKKKGGEEEARSETTEHAAIDDPADRHMAGWRRTGKVDCSLRLGSEAAVGLRCKNCPI